MSVRARTRTASLALALLGLACATGATPHGMVRVDLPDGEGGPSSPLERQLVQAVEDAVAGEGLGCTPGAGATLLRCSAAAVGNQGRGVTVTLLRAGTGYQVAVDQALRLPGRASPVCDVERRLRQRIDLDLAMPVTHVDNRSDCRQR